MILSKNLRRPLFYSPALAFELWGLYSTTARSINNPLIGLPIQKILKISSNKKCSTPQDAMFCTLIYQTLLAKNKETLNQRQMTKIGDEVSRLLKNSLLFIHQLNLLQTLMMANSCLDLINLRWLNIDFEVVAKFVQKINQNILKKIYSNNTQGKYLLQIVNYVKKLVGVKKSNYFIKQIMNYVVNQPKDQRQVVEILKTLYLLKHKGLLVIQLSIRKILQEEVGQKIDRQQLTSPLVDQIILKLFVELKFHYKNPYHCVPTWLLVLVQKIKAKYFPGIYGLDQDNRQVRNVQTIKKIQFVKNYYKLLKQMSILAKVNSIKQQHYFQLNRFMISLCSEFDYIQQADSQEIKGIYNKIMKFSTLISNYIKDQQLKIYQRDTNLIESTQQFFVKVYKRYFSDLTIENKLSEFDQLRLQSFQKYMKALIELLDDKQQKVIMSHKFTQKVVEKAIQLFQSCLMHNQENYRKYYKFFPLLSHISVFVGHEKYEVNKKKLYNISNYINNFVQSIQNTKVYQIYDNSKTADPITQCYLFMMHLSNTYNSQFLIPQKLQQLYKLVQQIDLNAIIQTVVASPLLQTKTLKNQLLRLCSVLKSNVQVYLAKNDSNIKGKYKPVESLSGFKFKSIQQELVGTIIMTLKSDQRANLPIFQQVHKFWFIHNREIIRKIFKYPKQSRFYETAWINLQSNISYIHNTTKKSGIDMLAQVIRICLQEQQVSNIFLDRYTQQFKQRSIYNILRQKTDEFSQYKYLWMVMLLSNSVAKVIKFKHVHQQSLTKFRGNKFVPPQKRNKGEYAQQVLSLYKVIQIICFCCHEMSQPLQISTFSFRSRYTCKVISQCLAKIISIIQSESKIQQQPYDGRQQSLWQNSKTKQNLLCSLPMEQIFNYFSLNNYSHQVQWIDGLMPSYMVSAMEGSYSKIVQYNSLLSFNTSNLQTKKAHDAFLSQQIMKDKYETCSTIIKYYRYLLTPNKEKQGAGEESVKISHIFSGQEVISYWLNKNIVIKTSENTLILQMIQRLIEATDLASGTIKITYTQFTVIINTLITLVDDNRITLVGSQNLINWIHAYLQKYQEYGKVLLYDYLVIRRYFGINNKLQNRIQKNCTQYFHQNKLNIVQQLYSIAYQMSEGNLQSFKSMLLRARGRSLLLDYYWLPISSQFRVNMFLNRIFALVYLQNNAQLLGWYYEQIFCQVDVKNLQEYLMEQRNFPQIKLLLMVYRLARYQLKREGNATQIQNLVEKVLIKFKQSVHQNISENQKKRQSNINKQDYRICEIEDISLFKQIKSNTYIYITDSSQLKTQQALELQYIKYIAKICNHTKKQNTGFQIQIKYIQ